MVPRLCGRMLAAALLVLLAGCGSDSPTRPTQPPNGGSNPPPATAPTVSSVSVTGNVDLLPGATSQLAASAVLSDGSNQICTGAAAWQSSNPAVATVSPTGVVTAVGVGAADISAAYQGLTGSLHVTVKAIGGTTEAAVVGPALMTPGQTTPFTATFSRTSLTTTDVCTATWESSNPSVATVTAGGRVTAVAAGETDIKAACGGRNATLHLTVSGVLSLTLKGVSPMGAGQSTQFNLTALLPDSSTPIVNDSAVWQSSNGAVAAVSATGVVTAISTGSATISAKYQGLSASFTVYIPASWPAAVVTVTGQTLLAPGQSTQLKATITPPAGTPQDCTNSATWMSLGGITVSPSGLATASSLYPQASVEIRATCQGVTGAISILVSSGVTYAISGTVTDIVGAPLAGVTIHPGNGINGSMSTTTDAAGHYRLAPLVPETIYLKADKYPYDTVQKTITSLSADTTVNFTLTRTYHVNGRVKEAVVGTLIVGATVEIVAGQNAGRVATTDAQYGQYTFDGVTPGSMTIRASKAGYDSAQQTVFQSEDMTYLTVDLALTPTTGQCLQSVSPVAFTYLPSAGGTGTIAVLPASGRSWTATPSDSWIGIVSGGTGSGPGTVTFTYAANRQSYGMQQRTATIAIGCSATEQQSVRVSQVASCAAAAGLRGGGAFEATGGTGYIDLLTDSPFSCEWQAVSRADWITITSRAYGTGDGGVAIAVAPNTTGAARTGTVTVAETTVTVSQKGQ